VVEFAFFKLSLGDVFHFQGGMEVGFAAARSDLGVKLGGFGGDGGGRGETDQRLERVGGEAFGEAGDGTEFVGDDKP
jgi:hypothetical protein